MRHEPGKARIAWALFGALLLGAPALAQQREYYVRGKVTDSDKKPLADVEIRLRDAATSRSYNMRTDKEGVFKFVGLPHAVYQVTFTREGYAPKTDEWKLASPQDRMQRVDFSDVVLVSQARVQDFEGLKQSEAAVKDAAERLRVNDPDGAIAALSSLLAQRPDDANALFLLGVGYSRKQMCKEALAPLTRVAELNPGFALVHFELGGCERKLGNAAKALVAFEKALELDAKNADAAYNAGLILFETSRIDEALVRFERGLALKPNDPDLLEMAGRCYIHQAKYGRAVELLEKARAAASDPAKAAFLDELVRKIKAGIKDPGTKEPGIKEPAPGRVIIGYVFPRDRVIEPAAIAADKLTHVNYAFINIENGVVVEGPRDAEHLRALTGLRAKHPHFKVLVSVGGWTWSGGFSEAAATAESRARLVASSVEFVRRHDLDGFDVDWEYPGQPGAGNPHGPQDKPNFTSLMAELRAALDQQGKARGRSYLLTMAAGASRRFLEQTEMERVAGSVDFVNLMTYDFRIAGSDPLAGHHANLYRHPQDDGSSADAAVRDFIAAGVPAHKLVLGVPFYGRAWSGVQGDLSAQGLYQPGGPLVGEAIETGYEKLAAELVGRNGFSRHWDGASQAPYLWNPERRVFISYDDPESLRIKCRYIRDKGLAGAMFWEYYADQSGALLGTLFEELRTNQPAR